MVAIGEAMYCKDLDIQFADYRAAHRVNKAKKRRQVDRSRKQCGTAIPRGAPTEHSLGMYNLLDHFRATVHISQQCAYSLPTSTEFHEGLQT